MAKSGLLLCVCQGTCPSFKNMDTMEVLNAIRRDKLVDFAALHPQLCAEDGDTFLRTLLDNQDIDKLYIAACDPLMQQKMFKDSFASVNFDKTKHIPLDIRNKTTEEAIAAVRKLIKG